MRYRFDDVWHTFVTRVAENPAVVEETIRQLAEHSWRVNPHIRVQTRRAAMAVLEPRAETASSPNSEGAPQNPLQYADNGEAASYRKPERWLNFSK